MKLKLVAVGCLHGKLQKKTLDLIRLEKPDAVIVSGDFSGGDFAEKLREYEQNLVDKFGPIPDLWPMKVQIESDKNFRKWGKMSAGNVSKIFQQLKRLSVPVLYIHGNWDSVAGSRSLMEGSGNFFVDKNAGKNMRFIHEKVARVNGYSIVGFGGYRGTSAKEYLFKDLPLPWPDSGYLSMIRKEMEDKMEKLFRKVRDKSKMIFVTHDPPYKTFDYLKSAGKFYGEKITRDMIRKHRPLICICSHFHEHRGVKRIGLTKVVATGFGYDGQAAVIKIDGLGVKVKLVG